MASSADPPPSPLEPATRSVLEGLATTCSLVLAIDEIGAVRFRSGGRDRAEPLCAVLEAEISDWLQRPDRSDSCVCTSPSSEQVYSARAFEIASPLPLRVALVDSSDSRDARGRDVRRRNEELETCVRSVSHDLRSPLVSVLGFARLMREQFGEPIGRTGRHFLDRIEQAGHNMERLLNDMLELSRIEDTPNCPVRVNPRDVLEQLSAELKPALDEAGVELSLPEDPPIVVCDRTRLYQLFSNLVGNAMRHMDERENGRIIVSVRVVDGGWEFSVEDNGPGIAAEDRERIFEAFQTVSPRTTSNREAPGNRTRAKKSSGLGLAIVRKIVETHRGRVWVESELGQGACFRVFLPCSEATHDATESGPVA